LRRDHPALRRGGLRWAHADVESLAYLRETAEERLLIIAVRDGTSPIRFPGSVSEGTPRRLFGDGVLEHEGDELVARIAGPAVGIWVVS
jgi:alpha-glucosidase